MQVDSYELNLELEMVEYATSQCSDDVTYISTACTEIEYKEVI